MNRIFEEFLLYKSANDGCADRTISAYRDTLARFEAWLAGKDPRHASSDDLAVFTGPYLHKKGLKAISRKPHISCLREFYAWAGRLNLVPANPATELDYPKTGRPLPRVMTLDNAEKLMWQPDLSTFEGVRDAAIISILIGCGLRISGVAALNRSNLITIIDDGEPRLLLRTTEKGDKTRQLPMPREAEMLVRVYLEHPELQMIDTLLPDGDHVLFTTTHNRNCPEHLYHGQRRRFSTRGLFKMVRKHGELAGIDTAQLHPHAIRHLFGTELEESDISPRVSQDLMGHADANSTKIYVHLATRKLFRDVDRANPLAKIKTPASDLLDTLRRR